MIRPPLPASAAQRVHLVDDAGRPACRVALAAVVVSTTDRKAVTCIHCRAAMFLNSNTSNGSTP